jgi:hypothetical protein
MVLCSLRCGLTYRCIFERSEAEIKSIASIAQAAHRIEQPKAIEPKTFGPPEASLKRKRIEDEVEDFRHVRLRDRPLESDRDSPESPQGRGSLKVDESIIQRAEGRQSPPGEGNGSQKRTKINLFKCRQCRDARKKLRRKGLIISCRK